MKKQADPRFCLGVVIGRGGSAAVYEALDVRSGRSVALKVLGPVDAISVARFEREARAAIAIRHPNVCASYESGRLADGRAFVAMELLRGKSLRQIIEAQGRLDVEEAIEIASQMLAALEVVHDRGIVHRDVKPENIFLTKDERRVKLLDFGVCRPTTDPNDDFDLTVEGCVVGTPGYLSPERAYGESRRDMRSDIFSAGLVLFEMLTGRRAYQGETTGEMALELALPVRTVRSVMPSVPRELETVITNATHANAADRYATAGRFLHDLLEARTAIRRRRAASLANARMVERREYAR